VRVALRPELNRRTATVLDPARAHQNEATDGQPSRPRLQRRRRFWVAHHDRPLERVTTVLAPVDEARDVTEHASISTWGTPPRCRSGTTAEAVELDDEG
jgi:hypothetical protein